MTRTAQIPHADSRPRLHFAPRPDGRIGWRRGVNGPEQVHDTLPDAIEDAIMAVDGQAAVLFWEPR